MVKSSKGASSSGSNSPTPIDLQSIMKCLYPSNLTLESASEALDLLAALKTERQPAEEKTLFENCASKTFEAYEKKIGLLLPPLMYESDSAPSSPEEASKILQKYIQFCPPEECRLALNKMAEEWLNAHADTKNTGSISDRKFYRDFLQATEEYLAKYHKAENSLQNVRAQLEACKMKNGHEKANEFIRHFRALFQEILSSDAFCTHPNAMAVLNLLQKMLKEIEPIFRCFSEGLQEPQNEKSLEKDQFYQKAQGTKHTMLIEVTRLWLSHVLLKGSSDGEIPLQTLNCLMQTVLNSDGMVKENRSDLSLAYDSEGASSSASSSSPSPTGPC